MHYKATYYINKWLEWSNNSIPIEPIYCRGCYLCANDMGMLCRTLTLTDHDKNLLHIIGMKGIERCLSI